MKLIYNNMKYIKKFKSFGINEGIFNDILSDIGEWFREKSGRWEHIRGRHFYLDCYVCKLDDDNSYSIYNPLHNRRNRDWMLFIEKKGEERQVLYFPTLEDAKSFCESEIKENKMKG
jgi:hypothetical protein